MRSLREEARIWSDRPRLSLNVGVTGHRPDRLPSAQDELRTEILKTFRLIRDSVFAIHGKAENLGYSPDPPRLRLVSSLAAGADQLTAETALAEGYELQAPLPFPRAEYQADFSEEARNTFGALLEAATAVLELDGNRDEAGAAYARAGRVMLAQTDVLIAIWDGEKGRGPGGTVQLMEEARQLRIPVIWINAHTPSRSGVLVGGSKQLELAPLDSIDLHLQRLLLPRIDGSDRMRAAFFSGRSAPPPSLGLFKYFRKLCLLGSKRTTVAAAADGEREVMSEADGAEPIESGTPFRSDYERADTIAGRYASVYRDSFVANYFLAVAAVATALVEGISAVPWATAAELLVLATILVLVGAARRGCWHQRWLSFRLLAEELRLIELSYPLGRVPAGFNVPAHVPATDTATRFVGWLVRARVRDVGMAGGVLSADRLTAARRDILKRIAEQRRYHAENSAGNKVIAHRLHLLGVGLFLAAFAAVCLHAIASFAIERLPEISRTAPQLAGMLRLRGDSFVATTKFLDAILPAFGAAFTGIASQGEFGRIAERSRGMEAALRQLLERPLLPVATSDECGRLAQDATDIMVAELLDWEVIFRDKDIHPPG